MAILSKERRYAAREYIYKYKNKSKCAICGSKKDLEFHHINPETKKYCVSDMIRNRNGLEAIKTEIDKCVILCRDCHMKVHNENLDLSKYI